MSVSYIVAMPWVYKKYRDECVATMAPEFKDHLFEVDNSGVNHGIMWSHNQAALKAQREGLDWVIILSAAIRFGPPGGLDLIKALEDNPDHYILHAGTLNHPPVEDIKKSKHQDGEYKNGVMGWHLTCFRRDVIDNVGLWEESLWPYGWCDIELSIRIQKFYKGRPGWGVVPVDVSDMGMAHGIHLAGVRPDAQPQIDFMISKWGRHPSDYQKPSYDHPFNDPTLPLSFCPKPPDPRAINHEGWKFNGY